MHTIYDDDCPRCLQRLLTPRLTETVRIGGGFKILEQGSEEHFNGHGAWRGRVPGESDEWSLRQGETTPIFDQRREKEAEGAAKLRRKKMTAAEEAVAAGTAGRMEFVRNPDSMEEHDADSNVVSAAKSSTGGSGATLRMSRGGGVEETEEEAKARKKRAKKRAAEAAAAGEPEHVATAAAETAAAAAAAEEEHEQWNGEGIKPRAGALPEAEDAAAAAAAASDSFVVGPTKEKKKKKKKKPKLKDETAAPAPTEKEPALAPDPGPGDDEYDDLAKVQKKRPERKRLMQMPKSNGKRRLDEPPPIKFKEKKYPAPLDYLARFCVLPEDKLHVFKQVFDAIDLDKDETISMDELNFGIRSVNQSMITSKESEYVNTVLEVRFAPAIDFQCFAVICALSEKVVALDRFVKHKINKMNPEAMELKINGCKDMYYMLDEKKDGFVEFDMLMREVRAGQITQEHEDIIIDKFMENGKSHVDFLDFLTYIPLFMEIHDTINMSPLDLERVN